MAGEGGRSEARKVSAPEVRGRKDGRKEGCSREDSRKLFYREERRVSERWTGQLFLQGESHNFCTCWYLGVKSVLTEEKSMAPDKTTI